MSLSEEIEELRKRNAKILYFDIETAPNLSYVWGYYEQNVIENLHDWYVLCASWLWEGQRRPSCVSQFDDKQKFMQDPLDDTLVLEKVWNLLDAADIVVAHNGDRFDLRKINARFIASDMSPPSPFKTIDTLKVARRHFAFNSNRLNDLGPLLGLGAKAKHQGFGTWLGCMNGDERAWREMIKYNKRDVTLLRDVYFKLRPFMSNHPNIARISNIPDACPTCGHEDMDEVDPFMSSTAAYQQWRCNRCGAFSRSSKRMKVEAPERVSVTRK